MNTLPSFATSSWMAFVTCTVATRCLLSVFQGGSLWCFPTGDHIMRALQIVDHKAAQYCLCLMLYVFGLVQEAPGNSLQHMCHAMHTFK